MARSALRDPLTKFRWTMEIPGFSRLAFTKCSMPAVNITPRIYPEGGQHWAPKSIPDKYEYKPIVLSRGVTNDTSFNKWANASTDLYTNNLSVKNDQDGGANLDTLTGLLTASPLSAVPSGFSLDTYQYRKDIRIDHVNRAGQVEVSYFIYGAYPISYQPGSDFDAMGEDSLSIDMLTLGYDSFEVKYAGIAGFAGNIAADFLL